MSSPDWQEICRFGELFVSNTLCSDSKLQNRIDFENIRDVLRYELGQKSSKAELAKFIC